VVFQVTCSAFLFWSCIAWIVLSVSGIGAKLLIYRKKDLGDHLRLCDPMMEFFVFKDPKAYHQRAKQDTYKSRLASA
jgi:hypothetical protein